MLSLRLHRGFAALVVLLTVWPLSLAAQPSSPLLHAVFQDHAVLQREAPIRVWGTAAPGETITLEMAGEVATAASDDNGRWTAQLPPLTAGGPYTLDARSTGGARQTLDDVRVGDVFFCSGQSNMELPVNRTLNAPTEIRNAANERIRMLKIGQASSAAPRDTFSNAIEWEMATPGAVPDWSAACYYFARDLQQHVDVPIGLINSSWGGSDIRAWMSEQALANVGGYEEALSLLDLYREDEHAAQQTFGEQWEMWWREATGDDTGTEPWHPQVQDEWTEAPDGLGDWTTWGTPELDGFNGMVWFRTTVELTAAQADQDATLSLGVIDEVDQTWINGRVVGNTFGWGTERAYTIPADLLQEGENVVVVNVLNTYGTGGMVSGDTARAFITGSEERLPLNAWQYRKAPADIWTPPPPRTPWESVGGRTTLHNAMVAPLRDYSLRGIVWYQGESNTDASAAAYQDLLDALKAQWRAQFGADLPILVVQLTNFGMPSTAPTESGWAEVREAQRRATGDDPRAGLAVTIDLGSNYDVHPANKQEVGRRLARAARHVIYDEALSPSGPVPVRATREGDAVAVQFEDIDDALVAHGHTAPIGFELCGSEPESCRYADAQIDGHRVLLRAEDVREATRVRYGWADSPTCTLYDASGLPAGPFELPVDD